MSSGETTLSMRARATVLRLAGITAALAAALVFAQEPAPADDLFPGVAEQIEAIQSTQGVNSPELIGPLTNLGLILREQGDTELAIAAFERARQLVRVNYGFSSFKEGPLLRQLVQIEEAGQRRGGVGSRAGADRLDSPSSGPGCGVDAARDRR
jgi:tetratricopeptide (TPR) repeat protein